MKLIFTEYEQGKIRCFHIHRYEGGYLVGNIVCFDNGVAVNVEKGCIYPNELKQLLDFVEEVK